MARIKRKIKFVGELRNIIGEEVEVAISDYRDLVSWMQNCYPDSRRILRADNTISIGVMSDGKVVQWIDEEYVKHGYIPECECLVVIADIQGAGVEIAAYLLSVAATSATAIIVGGIINIGISMAINAVIASLADKPDTNTAREEQSYLLNGATNNNRAGCAVPLLFGRWRASTVVISQAVTSERMVITHPDVIMSVNNVATTTGNLLANDIYIVGAVLDSIDYSGTNYVCPCTITLDADHSISFARDGSYTTHLNTIGLTGYPSWLMTYNVASQTTAGYSAAIPGSLKVGWTEPTGQYAYGSDGVSLNEDHG